MIMVTARSKAKKGRIKFEEKIGIAAHIAIAR